MTRIAIVLGLIGLGSSHAFGNAAGLPSIADGASVRVAVAAAEKTLLKGDFRDADRAHRGKGTATIQEGADGRRFVLLSDFKVTKGPDLKVWLSAHGDIRRSSDVAGAAHVSLGKLKRSAGDQSYDIPAGTDLSKFKSVVIWCEEFGVLFSAATLSP